MATEITFFDDLFTNEFDIMTINETTTTTTTPKKENVKSYNSCNHENTTEDKNSVICIDCGEEICEKKDKLLKEYAYSDIKNVTEMKKYDDKSIFKDIENYKFPENVVLTADKIYESITSMVEVNKKQQIFRGDRRKAIIFACIYHAHNLHGIFIEHNTLISIFSLERQIALEGIKYVNQKVPKDSFIRTLRITPIHLVREFMKQFSATEKQCCEVIELYNKIKNRSSKINQSRPQSIAAGIVYYWIKKNNINITIQKFIQICKLSILTIEKIEKEISNILDKNRKDEKKKKVKKSEQNKNE